jgi:hypothetical protein
MEWCGGYCVYVAQDSDLRWSVLRKLLNTRSDVLGAKKHKYSCCLLVRDDVE